MTAWIILPVSLSAFSITGIWIVYAMAVMNHHVCPVENWTYNASCSGDSSKHGYPKTCCTVEDIPLVIERSRCSWVNTSALIMGCTNAAGLVMVGNFQVDHAKALHYIGAGMAFPAGFVFICLQCILTYHIALTVLDYWMAYLRVLLTVVALITLVLSGIFFIHESFVLQHAAAICEWIFTVDILIFYGTFSYEFSAISNDTMLAAIQRSDGKACKSPGSSSTSTHLNCNPESIAMI